MSCLEFLTHNLYDDVSSLLAKYYKHFQVPSGALGGGNRKLMDAEICYIYEK